VIKPKIFISSRLSLAKVRGRLKEIFESAGFDVDLYEKDLTPSSEPATYLRDIRDADFVIFILDEDYGTPRPKTGRSGTHDEWEAAWELDIPRHVYLKRSNKPVDVRQRKFIQTALHENEVSYYFFKGQQEIASQAQKSMARIVFDIAESSRFRRRRSKLTLWADMAEEEYGFFRKVHGTVESLLRIEAQLNAVGWITYGWALLGELNFDPSSDFPFYDSTLASGLGEFLAALREVGKFESNWTEPGPKTSKGGPAIQFPGDKIGLSFFKFPVMSHWERRTHSPESLWKERQALVRKALTIWNRIRRQVNARHDRFPTVR